MPSERQEDEWCLRNVILPEHGFYLDLGCAWPVQNSNTAFLRRCGWRGLCVDGNPIYAPFWKGVETFVCAVIGDGNPVLFETDGAPDLSRIGSGTLMPTIRLDALVGNLPPIDFISCDLEGQEFAALSTLDWTKHRPKVIVSEWNTHGIGADDRVCEMLIGLGYKSAYQNEANQIFTL
jgi:hypothetical protein